MGIVFFAAFGDEDKKVDISAPLGGGGSYHIMIDNYYRGAVCKMSDGWHVYFNSDEWTMDDQQAILERLGIPLDFSI